MRLKPSTDSLKNTLDSFAAIRKPNAATIMNWLHKAARYKKEKLIFWQWTNCDNVQREFFLAQI